MISILVLNALLLTACSDSSETSAAASDLQEPQVSSSSQDFVPQVEDGSNQQAAGLVDMSARPVNDQTELIVGIFGLEGTDQAISAEQATSLIPLWNSLLELSQSQDATQEEADVLVEQIKVVLTADQLAAVENMAIDQQAVITFMQEHNIEMGGMQRGQGEGQSFPLGTPSADQMGNPAPGTPPAAGTPGASVSGGNPQRGTLPADQGQPADGQGQQPGRMGGFNYASSALIEALLDLLESK